MATKYNVISNQNWSDFYEKLRTVGKYKIDYKLYNEFLNDAYLEGMLLGKLTLETPKNEVTEYVHFELWKYLHMVQCKYSKGKNKHVNNAIRKIYTDCLNKIFD